MSESPRRLFKVASGGGGETTMDSFDGAAPVVPPYDGVLYSRGPEWSADFQTVPQHHLLHLAASTITLLLFESREPPCQSSRKNPNRWSRPGNRRHANHGSFDRRSYLIIQPSCRPGRESAARAAYCTICVSNCYDIELRVASGG